MIVVVIAWRAALAIVMFLLGRVNLHTATTQTGWCIEVFVSILAHSQSQKLLPEVVVYIIYLPNCGCCAALLLIASSGLCVTCFVCSCYQSSSSVMP